LYEIALEGDLRYWWVGLQIDIVDIEDVVCGIGAELWVSEACSELMEPPFEVGLEKENTKAYDEGIVSWDVVGYLDQSGLTSVREQRRFRGDGGSAKEQD
jgi:hypothetical protein